MYGYDGSGRGGTQVAPEEEGVGTDTAVAAEAVRRRHAGGG